MRSLSVPSRVFSAVGLAMLFLAALWLGGSFPGDAAAEHKFVLSTLDEASGRPSPVPALLASHHEDDDDDEDDEHSDEEEGLESELRHLEVERAALEAFFGGMELIEKVASIAADDDAVAVMAVITVADEFDTDEKFGFLKEVAEGAPSRAARRVARLKLAEWRREEGDLDGSLKQMRSIVFGDD